MAQAYDQVWKSITGIPAANLTGKRYHAVSYNADGNIAVTAAGKSSVGVLYEDCNVGQPAQVVASGFAFGKLGGTVATGAEVEVGTDGKFITLASGSKVGTCAVGGSADQIGTIFLDR